MGNKHKLIRITTVPISLKTLLKGQLKFMKENGFDVVAITSDNESIEEIEQHEGVPVRTIHMTREITPLKDIMAVWRMYKILKKEKPTIVHTHTPKAGIVGMMASWLARVPIRLHTVAGLPLLEASGNKRKLLDFVEKITYKFATKVYPNSNGLYDIILQEKFTTKDKLHVIGNGSSNGINTNHFDPKIIDDALKTSLRQQYKIGDNDFVFVFVGRIVGDKGIHELTNAFSRLSVKYKHIKLMLVGDFEKKLDPLSNEVEQILHTHPQIILTGFQNDVRPYYGISNALIFPSYREGFPNVVMQAGAMGLPCIVSDINGCNEIIIEGNNGYIIPVKNEEAIYRSMSHLIERPEEYTKMQAAARSRIVNNYEQAYVWVALHKEYLSLIQKIQ